jgi:hypothetical protein
MKYSGISVGKCESAGLAEGEIETKMLETRLEYISKTSHEVGMVFNYGGKASTVATFNCPLGLKEALRGEFMARITPVNTLSLKFPLALNGTKGTPEFTQYENEKAEKVTLSPLEIGEGAAFEKGNFKSTGLALEWSKEARIQA